MWHLSHPLTLNWSSHSLSLPPPSLSMSRCLIGRLPLLFSWQWQLLLSPSLSLPILLYPPLSLHHFPSPFPLLFFYLSPHSSLLLFSFSFPNTFHLPSVFSPSLSPHFTLFYSSLSPVYSLPSTVHPSLSIYPSLSPNHSFLPSPHQSLTPLPVVSLSFPPSLSSFLSPSVPHYSSLLIPFFTLTLPITLLLSSSLPYTQSSYLFPSLSPFTWTYSLHLSSPFSCSSSLYCYFPPLEFLPLFLSPPPPEVPLSLFFSSFFIHCSNVINHFSFLQYHFISDAS